MPVFPLSESVIFQCDVCHQGGFVNATTLRNHVRAMHSDERPFVCEYCPASYASCMSLTAHRSRKHNVNKAGEFVPRKLFPCATCGKVLTARSKLLKHIKVRECTRSTIFSSIRFYMSISFVK